MNKSASMSTPPVTTLVSSFIHSHSPNFENSSNDTNQNAKIVLSSTSKSTGQVPSSTASKKTKHRLQQQQQVCESLCMNNSSSGSSGSSSERTSHSSSPISSSPSSSSPTKLRTIDESVNSPRHHRPTTSDNIDVSKSTKKSSGQSQKKGAPVANTASSTPSTSSLKKKRPSLFNLFTFKIANNTENNNNSNTNNNSNKNNVTTDSSTALNKAVHLSNSVSFKQAHTHQQQQQHTYHQGSATLDHRRSPTAKKQSNKAPPSR